jgi:hypothetical protein
MAYREKFMMCDLTSADRRSEDVRILPVVVAELELSNIERHVFAADLVEGADNAALEDRPEALDCVRVYGADNVFVRGVIDDLVLRENLVEVLVTNPMVGHEQTNLVRNGLAQRIW